MEYKLIPIAQSDFKYKDGTYLWKYKCFCGKEFVTLRRSVINGHTRSCGCMRSISARQRSFENRTSEPNINTILNTKYFRYKDSANRKGLEFKISFDFFRSKVQSECFYCSASGYILGLDRLENSIGYDESNVVACCSQCNYFKGGLNYDQFALLIKKISENLNKYD